MWSQVSLIMEWHKELKILTKVKTYQDDDCKVHQVSSQETGESQGLLKNPILRQNSPRHVQLQNHFDCNIMTTSKFDMFHKQSNTNLFLINN